MPFGTIDKKFLNLMMTFELFKNSDGHCILGQAIGPLWDFCAPISIVSDGHAYS